MDYPTAQLPQWISRLLTAFLGWILGHSKARLHDEIPQLLSHLLSWCQLQSLSNIEEHHVFSQNSMLISISQDLKFGTIEAIANNKMATLVSLTKSMI